MQHMATKKKKQEKRKVVAFIGLNVLQLLGGLDAKFTNCHSHHFLSMIFGAIFGSALYCN